jgi:hypothetical protein
MVCGPEGPLLSLKLGLKIQKYGKLEYILYLTVNSIKFRAHISNIITWNG